MPDEKPAGGEREPGAPEMPAAAPAAPAPAEDPITRSRARRQAVLRRRKRSFLSETQQWLFVILALAIALAWIFWRNACSDVITKTYGTLDPSSRRDAGAARAPTPPHPPRDAAPPEDW